MLGCLRPLSSSRPKILARVSGIQIFGSLFLGHGFFQRANLLGFSKFWGRGGIRGFVGGGFPGFGLAVPGVLRTVVGHVAL